MKYIHDLTYWLAGDLDRYGNPTWDGPYHIRCRWEDVTKRFRNSDGDLDVSRAEVLVPTKLDTGTYIYKGKSQESSPISVKGAVEVKQYNEVWNVPGTKADRWVMV